MFYSLCMLVIFNDFPLNRKCLWFKLWRLENIRKKLQFCLCSMLFFFIYYLKSNCQNWVELSSCKTIWQFEKGVYETYSKKWKPLFKTFCLIFQLFLHFSIFSLNTVQTSLKYCKLVLFPSLFLCMLFTLKLLLCKSILRMTIAEDVVVLIYVSHVSFISN